MSISHLEDRHRRFPSSQVDAHEALLVRNEVLVGRSENDLRFFDDVADFGGVSFVVRLFHRLAEVLGLGPELLRDGPSRRGN